MDPETEHALQTTLDAAARVYDARAHGGLELVATYHCEGQRHEVAINRHPEIDWRVIDIHADGTASLVLRLSGYDDHRDQALHCASDYAEQWRLYSAGRRPDPPMLRRTPMRMQYQTPPTVS